MQLPWVTAPEDKTAELVGSIGDSIVSAKKRKDEKSRAAAEQLFRQKQLDQQGELQRAQIANFQSEADARQHAQEHQDHVDHLAATKDIQASLDAGKIDEANLKARAYKVKVAQEIGQAPGDTLMPMSAERPGAPTDEQVQQDAAGSAAAIAANPDMNEPGAPPANSPGLVRDLYNSRSAGRFEPAAPVAPKAAAFNIDGQRYDPAQTKSAEDATREEEAKRVEGAYAPVGFDKTAGALVRGNTGKAPEVDQAYIATQKAVEAEANRKALLDQRTAATMALHERDKLTREEQIAIAQGHDRANAGRGNPFSAPPPPDVRSEILRLKEQGVPDSQIIGNPAFASVNPRFMNEMLKTVEKTTTTNTGAARAVGTEMDKSLAPVTGKGGVRETQQHLGETISKLEANPDNPVEWTNGIDAMIKSNTGGKAIRAQYDLYMSHVGGTGAKFETWLQQARDGNLGPTYKANLLGAMKSELSQQQRLGGEYEGQFRDYQADPRIQSNPVARAAYEARHRGAFSTLNGGETIGNPITRAAGAKKKPTGGVSPSLDDLAKQYGL